MDAMRTALTKAGFSGFTEQKTQEAKVRWLFQNGLRSVLPIKQVKLHLGLIVTGSGLVLCDERYVTRRTE